MQNRLMPLKNPESFPGAGQKICPKKEKKREFFPLFFTSPSLSPAECNDIRVSFSNKKKGKRKKNSPSDENLLIWLGSVAFVACLILRLNFLLRFIFGLD